MHDISTELLKELAKEREKQKEEEKINPLSVFSTTQLKAELRRRKRGD